MMHSLQSSGPAHVHIVETSSPYPAVTEIGLTKVGMVDRCPAQVSPNECARLRSVSKKVGPTQVTAAQVMPTSAARLEIGGEKIAASRTALKIGLG